jgi:hypothetical protein
VGCEPHSKKRSGWCQERERGKEVTRTKKGKKLDPTVKEKKTKIFLLEGLGGDRSASLSKRPLRPPFGPKEWPDSVYMPQH